MKFRFQANQNPLAAEERTKVLANPGFGQHFTDHMVTIGWTAEQAGQTKAFEAGDYLKMVGDWADARVEPCGPLNLSSAGARLHHTHERSYIIEADALTT